MNDLFRAALVCQFGKFTYFERTETVRPPKGNPKVSFSVICEQPAKSQTLKELLEKHCLGGKATRTRLEKVIKRMETARGCR